MYLANTITITSMTRQRELMAMVKFGADEILRMDDTQGLTDENIDELLRRGEEKTEETHARIQKDMQVKLASELASLSVAHLVTKEGCLSLLAFHHCFVFLCLELFRLFNRGYVIFFSIRPIKGCSGGTRGFPPNCPRFLTQTRQDNLVRCVEQTIVAFHHSDFFSYVDNSSTIG